MASIVQVTFFTLSPLLCVGNPAAIFRTNGTVIAAEPTTINTHQLTFESVSAVTTPPLIRNFRFAVRPRTNISPFASARDFSCIRFRANYPHLLRGTSGLSPMRKFGGEPHSVNGHAIRYSDDHEKRWSGPRRAPLTLVVQCRSGHSRLHECVAWNLDSVPWSAPTHARAAIESVRALHRRFDTDGHTSDEDREAQASRCPQREPPA